MSILFLFLVSMLLKSNLNRNKQNITQTSYTARKSVPIATQLASQNIRSASQSKLTEQQNLYGNDQDAVFIPSKYWNRQFLNSVSINLTYFLIHKSSFWNFSLLRFCTVKYPYTCCQLCSLVTHFPFHTSQNCFYFLLHSSSTHPQLIFIYFQLQIKSMYCFGLKLLN